MMYNLKILMLLIACITYGASCSISNKTADQNLLNSNNNKNHFLFPKQKEGDYYWTLIAEKKETSLEEKLIQESLSGLSALAVNEDRSKTMLWINSDSPTYQRLKTGLGLKEKGKINVWNLLAKYDLTKEWLNGYILYNLDNPESINVATVASHVLKGVMISSQDSSRINKLGYKLLYDASSKTLYEAWLEFKDKCQRNGLILMPSLTSNQRSTAIAFQWMTVNLYNKKGDLIVSNNKQLLNDILMNLEPLSPVIGWEQSSSEDEFVSLVSRTGNIMLPFDWAINTPILSSGYEKRKNVRAKTIDPNKISYNDAENYISFWLSDGDNIQWMINAFDTPSYYDNQYASELGISFGYPFSGLKMVSPDQHEWLINKQPYNTSLIESLGGGYYYPDNFGDLKDRKLLLDKISFYLFDHMNESGCKVLGLICQDVDSQKSFEAYQKYISTNNNLIGIVALQYSPYAGGNGDIYWFENSDGVNIPVVTARYTLWNCGLNSNREREGTPAYIAKCYNDFIRNENNKTFSVTSVHAWSSFKNTNGNLDLTSENETNGKQEVGITPVKWCIERLSPDFKIVNVEELMWQLRMHTYPEQTNYILSQYN